MSLLVLGVVLSPWCVVSACVFLRLLCVVVLLCIFVCLLWLWLFSIKEIDAKSPSG